MLKRAVLFFINSHHEILDQNKPKYCKQETGSFNFKQETQSCYVNKRRFALISQRNRR